MIAAGAENLKLKDQLLALQHQYEQSQQLLVAFSATLNSNKAFFPVRMAVPTNSH